LRIAITIGLALLVEGCAAPRAAPPRTAPLQAVHAPPGWQSFCFPLGVQFVGETDTIANDNQEVVRAILGSMYRGFQWYHLVISAGGPESRPAPAGLAERRAQAILRILPSFGVRADRVEVEFVSEMSLFERDAAFLTPMIPPEEVERQRVERETLGRVEC
jgi:hypothetical protein